MVDIQTFIRLRDGVTVPVEPLTPLSGQEKLMQRTLVLLLSDDGELLSLVGSSVNVPEDPDSLLTLETSRVMEGLSVVPDDADDSEIAESLTLWWEEPLSPDSMILKAQILPKEGAPIEMGVQIAG